MSWQICGLGLQQNGSLFLSLLKNVKVDMRFSGDLQLSMKEGNLEFTTMKEMEGPDICG